MFVYRRKFWEKTSLWVTKCFFFGFWLISVAPFRYLSACLHAILTNPNFVTWGNVFCERDPQLTCFNMFPATLVMIQLHKIHLLWNSLATMRLMHKPLIEMISDHHFFIKSIFSSITVVADLFRWGKCSTTSWHPLNTLYYSNVLVLDITISVHPQTSAVHPNKKYHSWKDTICYIFNSKNSR